MKPSVILVPGSVGIGAEHWMLQWQALHRDWRLVDQTDSGQADRTRSVDALDRAILDADSPVVLVAHGLGCITVAHWAEARAGEVVGAFLAAPADVEASDWRVPSTGFVPIPLLPLPFPSVVVASTNDPLVAISRAQAMAEAWGSRFIEIGAAGHLDPESGHGPWPEGLQLLKEEILEAGG